MAQIGQPIFKDPAFFGSGEFAVGGLPGSTEERVPHRFVSIGNGAGSPTPAGTLDELLCDFYKWSAALHPQLFSTTQQGGTITRMQSHAQTGEAYLKSPPEGRRAAIGAVRKVILENVDVSYEEGIQYGIVGYYVRHRVYAKGYHCDPKQPLPFAALAHRRTVCRST